MKMPKFEIFHLSVNSVGVVSLWDTKAAAIRGRQPSETYVQLVLTEEQQKQLQFAQKTAHE